MNHFPASNRSPAKFGLWVLIALIAAFVPAAAVDARHLASGGLCCGGSVPVGDPFIDFDRNQEAEFDLDINAGPGITVLGQRIVISSTSAASIDQADDLDSKSQSADLPGALAVVSGAELTAAGTTAAASGSASSGWQDGSSAKLDLRATIDGRYDSRVRDLPDTVTLSAASSAELSLNVRAEAGSTFELTFHGYFFGQSEASPEVEGLIGQFTTGGAIFDEADSELIEAIFAVGGGEDANGTACGLESDFCPGAFSYSHTFVEAGAYWLRFLFGTDTSITVIPEFNPAAVPEPTALLLFIVALIGLLARRGLPQPGKRQGVSAGLLHGDLSERDLDWSPSRRAGEAWFERRCSSAVARYCGSARQ